MIGFITKTLLRRLVTILLAVSVIPMIIVTVIAIYMSSNVIKDESYNALTSIMTAKKNQLTSYFKERIGNMGVLANNVILKNYIKEYLDIFDDKAKTEEAKQEALKKFVSQTSLVITPYLKGYDYDNILILGSKGNILFDEKDMKLVGLNVCSEKFEKSSLPQLYKDVLNDWKIHLADAHLNPFGDINENYMACPIMINDKLDAVMVFDIGTHNCPVKI